MPPKNSGASKKTVEKVKQKIVEDKTFGLKNKKGKKQQEYIKHVAKQVTGDKKASERGGEQANKLTKKELEKKKLDELNELFKPVQEVQKVAFGVDPKSVVCMYFKQGTCQKGNKCKFSHDLTLERRSEKRSLYEDIRTEENKEETMNDWDQKTLEDVVTKKHGGSNAIKTEIVCKYFLDAIDKNQYGWFWNCPNGDKCIYRHALPPGFVLNKDKKNEEEEKNKISLEELIENERNALTGNLTPVTYESFMAWKKQRIADKKDKYESDMKKKKEEFKSGKGIVKVSGKEVFMFKPELADADDEEADDNIYQREQDPLEEDVKVQDIDLESFASSVKSSIDDSIATRVSTLSVKDRESVGQPSTLNGCESVGQPSTINGAVTKTTDDNTLDPSSDLITSNDVVIDGIPVDESLFEDIDDLDIGDDDVAD
ncbi:zinc finger CCCH domain-containing protein 15 isoform X1 [Hydra vulgaris]|uniref:zinc finger CCCH domain-containing protein 15 isoform X1 n=1 Tax=Hydra vulgaris TaxID=6087 RepID=UPI0006415CCA|nr:zinc finger CCCH domain-containing protein 15 [Hydra vulgaris]